MRWATGALFGLTGVVASWPGTALNRQVDPDVLLLVFSGLMLVAALGMVRHVTGGDTADHAPDRSDVLRPVGGRIARFAGAGLLVGFLTGFLGVGGGFIIVPALVVALDFPMTVAVGTSLLVISLNSAAALIARAGNATFHWSLIVPFTAAAILGSLLGGQAAKRTSHATLRRAFAGLLALVAAYVAIRSGVGLA